MGEFSLTHWLIIAVIALLFFGPKRLPGLGQSLGESIRGFKKAMSDDNDAPKDSRPREKIVSAEEAEFHRNQQTTTKPKDPNNT